MCENGVKRKTIFRRGAVEGAVLTYKMPSVEEWSTMVFVFGDGDNPGISNISCSRAFADRQHDEAVRMVQLMGFETGGQ